MAETEANPGVNVTSESIEENIHNENNHGADNADSTAQKVQTMLNETKISGDVESDPLDLLDTEDNFDDTPSVEALCGPRPSTPRAPEGLSLEELHAYYTVNKPTEKVC